MLKIGEFSRIAQVTTKTLRHYDERGLLKPTWTDRFTGYRYYNLDLLPQLNRILALKDLGFSLEQVHQVLQEDLTEAELRGMMRMKRLELEERIKGDKSRLARIEARMDHLDRDGLAPEFEVIVKAISPTWVFGLRQEISGYAQLANVIAALQERISELGLSGSISGPLIGIYHDAEYKTSGLDVEIAAPLVDSPSLIDSTHVYRLPGLAAAACLLHRGSYSRIPEAHQALLSWLEKSHFQMTGAVRDVYLQPPTRSGGDANLLAEIQFDVRPKPSLSALTNNKEYKEMEPKIVTKPAFTVVGLLYHGRNENNEIPQLWGELNPRFPEIIDKVTPPVAYGVCGPMETDGSFPYLAGFAVREAKDLPDGMTTWDVPEATYAVFPCTLKTIHETYEYAFKTWLPQSPYIHINKPDFEYYDHQFDQDQNLSIYIPVKAK